LILKDSYWINTTNNSTNESVDKNCWTCYKGLWVLVFNATFNNISVISWRPVLLMDETGVKPRTCRKSLTNFITLCCIKYTSPWAGYSNWQLIFLPYSIFSLFNLLFFHIFQIFSLFNLLFFHNFHIFSPFNLLFFCIFHIISKKTQKKDIADVEYYTTYPKTPEKRAGNPNFWLWMRAPKGIPFGVTWLMSYRWKGPTRVDIAQLPVAHARTLPKEPPTGWRDIR
jgi:hypothetical protein